MRILVYSPSFAPNIGGLEAMMEILAEGFCRCGHEVKVVCTTPDDGSNGFPFEVIRNPRPRTLLLLAQWADVFLQGNVSLKGIWPWFLSRSQLVVSHQGWYSGEGWSDLRGKLKNAVTRVAKNVSASNAVAQHIPGKSTVIHNAYRDDIFRTDPALVRNRDIIYVGRLVSDKGVDVLIEALSILAERNLRPNLTVVGDGPEAPILRDLSKELGIAEQISFVGVKKGLQLARIMNTHRLMVVPSNWEEPFGIVALEGIACGCVVIGTDGGGLPEAIGPCGVTIPRGDCAALADAIQALHADEVALSRFRAMAPDHLANHSRARIVDAYLGLFDRAVGNGGRSRCC